MRMKAITSIQGVKVIGKEGKVAKSGDEFECSEEEAQRLEDKGAAVIVGESEAKAPAKQAKASAKAPAKQAKASAKAEDGSDTIGDDELGL